jgi:cytoskeletal protein CcmA (bactofilin family)
MPASNTPKRLKTLRRKRFVARGSDKLAGNLVSGVVCVGGDFEVPGDLSADMVCVLGRLTVGGTLHADYVYTGMGIDVGGNLRCGTVQVQSSFGTWLNFDEIADTMAALCELNTRGDDEFLTGVERVRDDELLDLVDAYYEDALVVVGDCAMYGDTDIGGNVVVGGLFNPDDASIAGALEAGSIFGEGDLRVTSSVDCKTFVEVQGDVFLDGDLQCERVIYTHRLRADSVVVFGADDKKSSLCCLGDLEAGSIECGGSILVDGGSIRCEGYIRSPSWILATGTITAGRDHGVLAVLNVPRSQWLASGYVCAQAKPRNLLTGAFRPLGRTSKDSDGPRPARVLRKAR